MSYIHCKNQSNWNAGTESADSCKFENDGHMVTLTIMGINKTGIVPMWTSDNEKLFELHYMQGLIAPHDPLPRSNSRYFLSQKSVIECCEYLDTNTNFLMQSNPYEDTDSFINMDSFGQFILKNISLSDITLMASYVEKPQTRVSISQILLYELERTLLNTKNSLHIDIVKMTNNQDLGTLSIPSNSNMLPKMGMAYNDRIIFESMEQFLTSIRQKKNIDFSFRLGLGRSEVINTNKEFEYQLSKSFSLCTVDPKLRTYSISLFEERIEANPVTDYIFYI